MIRKLAVFLALSLCPFVHGQDILGDDKNAYIVMPATVICDGPVMAFWVSPTQDQVLIQRVSSADYLTLIFGEKNQPIPKNFQFKYSIYNFKSRVLTDVPLNPQFKAQTASWFGDGNHILFQSAAEPSSTVYQVALRRTISLPGKSFDVASNEVQGLGPLIYMADEKNLGLLFGDGSTRVVELGQNTALFWMMNQTPTTVNYLAREMGASSSMLILEMNRQDFSIKRRKPSFDESQRNFRQSSPNPFQLFSGDSGTRLVFQPNQNRSGQIPAPDPESLKRNYLRGEVLVGLKRDLAKFLSPSQLVILQGGALVTRVIQPTDWKSANALAANEVRTEIISRAKQAALALIIFASDNDDNLPGKEDWRDKIFPYSKNRSVIDMFNYTLGGGNLKQIENPSQTELGHMAGPGGRAIAYADGSVRWKPDGA